MAQTGILLRIESKAVKHTRTGWRNKGVLSWEDNRREMRQVIYHVLMKVVPAVVEAKGTAT